MTFFSGDIFSGNSWRTGRLLVSLFFLSSAPAVWAKGSPTPVPDESSSEDENTTPTPTDLSQMSLEKLADLDVKVTSSAKKTELLRDATSAIYVITAEDIRRSGKRTLPDLLAMVPGVQVARQSANEWAISARGFNSQYNNKMLVLVDGQSVYDPVFGGVRWNEQDYFLPDIDHIEVIRGPGGTLWGSNAVNGIVNIITKDSKNTQGVYISSLGGLNLYSGTQDPRIIDSRLLFRYGSALRQDITYRLYGQFSSEGPFVNPKATSYEDDLGSLWNDDWYDFRFGGRLDWRNDVDQITLESEIQKGSFKYARLTTAVDPVFNPNNFQNLNDLNTQLDQNASLSLKWSRDFSDGSELMALGTYSYRNFTDSNDDRIENLGQAEVQFQHRFPLGGWNEVTYGGEFRNYSIQFLGSLNEYFLPSNEVLNIYGGYLQDRATLVENRLFLTGGLKLENNTHSGDEWQPSGRILFTPNDHNSIWAAVSRAVRIPVEAGTNLTIYFGGIPADYYAPGTPPVNTYGGYIPNPNLESESLVSYEVGYRTNPRSDLSLDVAAYYNQYDDIIHFVNIPGDYYSPAGGVISSDLIAVQPQNGGPGAIYGIELASEWKPLTALRINLSYTYQDYDQAMVAASNLESGAPPPHHLANARVYFDPWPDFEFNTAFYFTDTTYLFDPLDHTHIVDAYYRWDLNAAYKPGEGVRLELGATDLEGGHVETLPAAYVDPAQVVPSLYSKMSFEF